MSFILYLVIFIILCIFILLQFFNIYNEKTNLNYEKGINIVIYLIFILTIIAIVINVIAFIKTYKKTGIMGNLGVAGAQGKQGRTGKCNSKCGVKVCYIDVSEYANKYFQKLNKKKKKIRNKDFLNKINRICNSPQYNDILVQKHHKKPTEEKMIKYIKGIIKQWIDIIVNHTTGTIKGIDFLVQPNLKFEDILNINNKDGELEKINEIQLYDIWKWTEEKQSKKLKLEITTNNLELPTVDEAQLYIMKTNNYKKVYDAETFQDEWDIENCPYNQMGTKRNNPNNLDKCVYVNPRNLNKEYKPTWKNKLFNKAEEVSLYNTIPYKNKNKQNFYPVGSIWRGKNSDERSKYGEKTPSSKDVCGGGHGLGGNEKYYDKGPEKETILVSGDVTSPKSFKKIWDSKKKCPECQPSSKATQIFRPIPKEGYTCLGDVVIRWMKDDTTGEIKEQLIELEKLNIKCVPSKCVRKKKLGPRVWSNMDIDINKFKDYISYTTKKPYYFNNQLKTALWDAGNSDSGEEITNKYGIELNENGGYNLFRTSQDYNKKPDLDTYVIKEECLLPAGGKIPKQFEFNLDKLKENIKENGSGLEHQKTTNYFGRKPIEAVITNYDSNVEDDKDKSLHGPLFNNSSKIVKGDKKKSFFLVDDNSRPCKKDDQVSDSYFIKTYNEKKNDFSSCLKLDINDNVVVSPICDYKNPAYKWGVDYSNKSSPTDKSSTTDKSYAKVQIKSIKAENNDNPKKCLKNYYNSLGKNINELDTCGTLSDSSSGFNSDTQNAFLYQTLTMGKLPCKISQKRNSMNKCISIPKEL